MGEQGQAATNNGGGLKLTKTQIFLAKALDLAREPEFRFLTNDDLLHEFGPSDLMRGFADNAKKRAEIIERTAGTKEKLALSFSHEFAAETLAQALEVEVTNADEIFSMISAYELVATQDSVRIWRLLYDNGWLIDDSPASKTYMRALYANILEESLLGPTTPLDFFKLLGTEAFVSDRVPANRRQMLLELIMMSGEPLLRPSSSDSSSLSSKATPYTAKDLLHHMGLDDLVEFNPVHLLVRVLDQLAKEQRWVKEPTAPKTVPPEAADEPVEAPEQKGPDAEPDAEAEAENESDEASDDPDESIPPPELIIDGVEEESDEDKTGIVQNPLAEGEKARPPAVPPPLKKRRKAEAD